MQVISTLDFKLQFYFNKYKNLPLPNRNRFKLEFRKKHGNFEYLNELIIMIENYQLKKFGSTLNSNQINDVRSTEQYKKIAYRENARERRRLK